MSFRMLIVTEGLEEKKDKNNKNIYREKTYVVWLIALRLQFLELI